jgi:DNA-binding transcriptional LysR family regulator
MIRGSLDDLAAFAVVARERNFTRAASDLGLSTSMLSYKVKRLETKLGIRLLQRNSRSVAPTEAGNQLLEVLGPALANINVALDELDQAQGKVSGVVRITATRQGYEAIIRPILSAFAASHPDATIEILIEYEFRDIIADRLDAGIRIGEKLEQDMIALRVSPELRMAVVASPSYFLNHPNPKTPHELSQSQCISYRLRAHGPRVPWWFSKDGQEIEVKVEGPLCVNEPELALNAAVDGLGLAYVMEDMAARHIANGSLVRLLEDWSPTFPGFYLYYPSRAQMPAALEALLALLRMNRHP